MLLLNHNPYKEELFIMKKFEYTVEGCAAAREFLILNNYLTNVQLDYMDGYNIVHTANLFLIRKKEEESGN